LLVNNLGAAFTTDVTFNNATNIGGKLRKSGVLGTKTVPTTQVTPSAITKSTYIVDSNFTLPIAEDGQEITIINVATTTKSILNGAGTMAATSIALTGTNSTVTLRCFNNEWFVIASHNTNIV
jgi:hypothetical protein